MGAFEQRPTLTGEFSSLAARIAALESSARVKVVTEAPINVKYPEYGAVGDDAANDATAINNAIAAAPATGGQIFLPPGIYRHNVPISADAKKVEIIGHRAKLKATAAMAQSILLNKITDAPGFGVRGVVIDMASLASIGLVVKNCWATTNDIRVENPASGTCVKVTTDDSSFGVYYNRIMGQARGNDTAGSIGVLIEGESASNRANHNIVDRFHATDLGTGIKIGSQTDANNLLLTDCTSNAINYDFTSGVTHGFGVWEEASSSKGFIVRTGASAYIEATYFETREAEGTGILEVNRNTSVTTTAGTLDRQRIDVVGLGVWREQFDTAAGRFSWKEDGQNESFGVDNNGVRIQRGSVRLPSYTTAGRPTASDHTGGLIYVSDAAANNKLQYSDGSNWIVAG